MQMQKEELHECSRICIYGLTIFIFLPQVENKAYQPEKEYALFLRVVLSQTDITLSAVSF